MNHALSTRSFHVLRRNRGPNTMVGHTPTLWVSTPFADAGRGFWAKLEGFNPGGMKDRPAMHMVEQARARGDLKPGGRIIESTSGTLGLGLGIRRHDLSPSGHAGDRSRSGTHHRAHADRLRCPGFDGDPAAPHRRLAAGPAGPGGRAAGGRRHRLVPGPIQQSRTTSRPTGLWRWNSTPRSAMSTSWSARSARAGIRPGWRGCCGSSTRICV